MTFFACGVTKVWVLQYMNLWLTGKAFIIACVAIMVVVAIEDD